MQENKENEDQELEQQPGLEPVEQESIAFHGDNIIAVRLADGRIAVVLRWICESLKIRPNGQVNRIKRTAAIAGELVRVKVQTRGGRQDMPAVTLRGFPTWVLGINPNEVKDDSEHPEQAERIRQMIIAYQVEAVDVLYNHFAQKAQRPALPVGSTAAIVREQTQQLTPARPSDPRPEASDEELTTYYEDLAVWAYWQAKYHAQKWRGQVDEWRGQMEARIESSEAIAGLLPEIIDRLGPETITPTHQGQVKGYVKRLHELTGKPYPTIYESIRLAFGPARYQDLLETDWTQIEQWFQVQIERAKRR